jgi:hypothetical protein
VRDDDLGHCERVASDRAHLLLDIIGETSPLNDDSSCPITFLYKICVKWEDGLVEDQLVYHFIDTLHQLKDVSLQEEEGELVESMMEEDAGSSDEYIISDAEQEYGCLLPLKKRTAAGHLLNDLHLDCLDQTTDGLLT